MKTRAAVAWEAGKPLEIEMLDLEGPKTGEVLLRNVATGVCHTDAFTLSGEDPEGIFPAVLGHEGGAIVEEIGDGVTSVKVGDHVIPLVYAGMRRVQFLHFGKNEFVSENSRHARPGTHARWHLAFLGKRQDCIPLHGHVDI